MTSTQAFCTECISNVALDDSSPQAKIFVDAHRCSKQNQMLILEDGLCSRCGKPDLIVYYMMPESTA